MVAALIKISPKAHLSDSLGCVYLEMFPAECRAHFEELAPNWRAAKNFVVATWLYLCEYFRNNEFFLHVESR